MQRYFCLLIVIGGLFLAQEAQAQNGSWKLFPSKKSKQKAIQEEKAKEAEVPVEKPVVEEKEVEKDTVANPYENQAGTLEVVQEYRISALMQLNDSLNKSKGTIPGFRVQIGSETGSNSKMRAAEVQREFLKEYPGVPSYVKWESPNYRVRIGDFRTALEAKGMHEKLKEAFPGAYVVRDEIQMPEIKSRKK